MYTPSVGCLFVCLFCIFYIFLDTTKTSFVLVKVGIDITISFSNCSERGIEEYFYSTTRILLRIKVSFVKIKFREQQPDLGLV